MKIIGLLFGERLMIDTEDEKKYELAKKHMNFVEDCRVKVQEMESEKELEIFASQFPQPTIWGFIKYLFTGKH